MLYSHTSDLSLPSEIILRIIEAMDYEPQLPGKLMSISKVSTGDTLHQLIWTGRLRDYRSSLKATLRDFYSLVKTNERSLSTHFGLEFLTCHQFLWRCQACESAPKCKLLLKFCPLMSSVSISVPLSLRPRTFPWLREAYERFVIANELVVNRFSNIIAGINTFFPHLREDGHCIRCLAAQLTSYLRLSINVLFRIFDARYENSRAGRAAQEEVIRSATHLELALVNLLLYISSLYHCFYSNYAHRSTGAQREMQSVLRELSLKHGPQIIWASLFGDEGQKEKVGESIERGLMELRLFEHYRGSFQGEIIFTPSLQSVLMREFCKKEKCAMVDGLNAVFESVKQAVLFPEPNKPHVH